MKVVLQRVKQASVSIDNKTFSSIDKGLLIFIGIEDDDNESDINWLSSKIVQMRVFNDKDNNMNLSVKDVKGDLLVVSQFTLQASTKKGNRPSYIKAARPEIAIPIYEKFISRLEVDLEKTIKTGVFGADMDILLLNNGPVTIVVDSKNKI